MATNDRQAREERSRLRTYQARQEVHRRSVRRRTRDNVLAGIGLVVVLTLAVVAQLFYFSAGPGAPEATPTPTPTPEAEAPSPDLAEDRTWVGALSLNDVPLSIELDGQAAPQAVASTVSLADSGFYDGLACHRLTTQGIFVLQCGDPNGDGTGGPGYSYGPIENAPADDVYPAGTIAMARAGGAAESQGSQFFIVYEDSTIPSDAAGGYTVIGRVTDGLDALRSDITDLGVADGAPDGAPADAVTITAFEVE
ncbi:peptidylprolyl isomerase [Agromyces sp. SYSU T0242]|uniref:peptidylprolyl isomerase n=1 Tax=Agromyces litoreus TaxID=3158561 RepID=UPI003398B686